MDNNCSVAIVILAAGGASRFGSPKQIAKYKQKHLLQRVIDECLEINTCGKYVVLGANYEEIFSVVNFTGVEIIRNKDWEKGMANSLHKAIHYLENQYDSVLFLAADQIKIKAEHIRQLIQVWKHNKDCLVAAEFGNEITIPAIFPKLYFRNILALSGDKGGKRVLIENKNKLITVDMPEAEFDIDYRYELDML